MPITYIPEKWNSEKKQFDVSEPVTIDLGKSSSPMQAQGKEAEKAKSFLDARESQRIPITPEKIEVDDNIDPADYMMSRMSKDPTIKENFERLPKEIRLQYFMEMYHNRNNPDLTPDDIASKVYNQYQDAIDSGDDYIEGSEITYGNKPIIEEEPDVIDVPINRRKLDDSDFQHKKSLLNELENR